RLDGYAGQSVRLTLTIRSEPGDARSDLALSLPGGRILALFNPAQTRQLALDFVPEADDQRLLLHALDMSCAADSPAEACLPAVYDGIMLTVSLTPLDG